MQCMYLLCVLSSEFTRSLPMQSYEGGYSQTPDGEALGTRLFLFYRS